MDEYFVVYNPNFKKPYAMPWTLRLRRKDAIAEIVRCRQTPWQTLRGHGYFTQKVNIIPVGDTPND